MKHLISAIIAIALAGGWLCAFTDAKRDDVLLVATCLMAILAAFHVTRPKSKT